MGSELQQPPAKPARPSRHAIVLTSPTIQPNRPVPRQHTTQGADTSPALAWSNLPPNTKEIVVALEDGDANVLGDRPFFQWMVYGIPSTAKGLPAKLGDAPRLMNPPGIRTACQARTRYDITAYRGPQPPAGELHHYRYVVYALDRKLDLQPGLFANSVMEAISKHIIGEGEIRATYKRTP